jgi:hypothetical protein
MGAREGWVASLADRSADVDTLRSALIARMIVAVRYVELDYGVAAWDCGRFHSIGFGVELDLDDGATWSFIWQQEDANETLLSYAGRIMEELRPEIDVSTWDVGDQWRETLPRAIEKVETIWTKHRWGPAFGGPHFETQVDDGRESEYCLITALLSNDCDDYGMIALGGDATDGKQTFTYLADNVAVLFSLEEARAARVLREGDPDALP